MALAGHRCLQKCCPSPPSPPSPNCSIPWHTQVPLVGHSRVPAPQCPQGQQTEHLSCTVCPRFCARFLLKLPCCLLSEAEMNTSPNSSPTPRRKMRNCLWMCIRSQPGMACRQKGPFSKNSLGPGRLFTAGKTILPSLIPLYQ